MLFCHFDIEADGPDPLNNSMISIGVTFTDKNGKELDSFLGDITPLQGHMEDEPTMTEFWNRDEHNRAELARIRANARPAFEVMSDLSSKISNVLTSNGFKRMNWIAKPSSYDWQWVNCYWNLYLRSISEDERAKAPRLPFKAICMSTMRDIWQYSRGLSRKDAEAQLSKAAEGLTITHNPLDDCRCQAKQYFFLIDQFGIKL